jgi:fatty acid desaturase
METLFIVALSVASAFALIGLIIGHRGGDQGDLTAMFATAAGARIAGAIIGLIAGGVIGFIFGLLVYGVPLVATGIVVVVVTITILEFRRNKADWDAYNWQHGLRRQ